ncbi:MAG: hypothetical protein RIQ93_2887 [Verrucomicrobiota bacterium]|jgi:predicted esterase
MNLAGRPGIGGFTGMLLLLALTLGWGRAAEVGQDLRLTFRSPVDGSHQPYRLYVPSSYRSERAIPLVIALHGSDGNENSFFDDEAHYPAKDGLKQAAEKFGVLAACPTGRGNTNYRGPGENSVLCVLEDVRRRFRLDDDRIYLTGHSMGGTGSADLAFHHPGLFAAVAPLAAARSIRWLAANAGHTPFWWIGGEKDQDIYKIGVAVGVARMQRLGCPVQFTELTGESHYGVARDFTPVIAWLTRHQRIAHPKSFTFEVDTLLHPRAYWITVDALTMPGKIGRVKAHATTARDARLEVENLDGVSMWPDPAVFDVGQAIDISVGGQRIFSGRVAETQEVAMKHGRTGWEAKLQPRRPVSLTAYRTHPVAFAPESMNLSGTEARLGNWIADAMRAATGTDVALYNHRVVPPDQPLPAGPVDIVDLLQCSLPGDQDLVMLELSGRDLLEILDANIPAGEARGGLAANLLVQISGARYAFNRRLPPGNRIVSSSLEPGRVYSVVVEGQVVERETMRLAGRYKKLKYRTTDTPFTVALYGHAARSKELRAREEGRVEEIK